MCFGQCGETVGYDGRPIEFGFIDRRGNPIQAGLSLRIVPLPDGKLSVRTDTVECSNIPVWTDQGVRGLFDPRMAFFNSREEAQAFIDAGCPGGFIYG